MSITLHAGRRPPITLGLPEGGDPRRQPLAWRVPRVRRNPSAIAGAIIVAVFVLVAVFAPLLTPYAPARRSGRGR